MSKLIKTLNLFILEMHIPNLDVPCEELSKYTNRLPCYMVPPESRDTVCEECVFNSNDEALPTVKILSRFHE